jgi:hypothetical protein
MSDSTAWIYAACFAAGVLGAALGGWAVWRAMRVQRRGDTATAEPIERVKPPTPVVQPAEPARRPQRVRMPSAEATPAIPARPPEPPPQQRLPVVHARQQEPGRELTDEEIDAMPPELPAPVRPRKRVLPPPKKQAWREL